MTMVPQIKVKEHEIKLKDKKVKQMEPYLMACVRGHPSINFILKLNLFKSITFMILSI